MHSSERVVVVDCVGNLVPFTSDQPARSSWNSSPPIEMRSRDHSGPAKQAGCEKLIGVACDNGCRGFDLERLRLTDLLGTADSQLCRDERRIGRQGPRPWRLFVTMEN